MGHNPIKAKIVGPGDGEGHSWPWVIFRKMIGTWDGEQIGASSVSPYLSVIKYLHITHITARLS